MILLIVAMMSMTVATFAWYIYNTEAHTTDLHMAAGTSVSLEISKEYAGTYGSSVVLDSFVGRLNPVSTNNISRGFQKVIGFTDGSDTRSNLVANLFSYSTSADYYKTTLYLKSAGDLDIYLSNIGYTDSRPATPISTATRIGFVVYAPGENASAADEFIFEINKDKNPEREYNTATGYEGCVLDCTTTAGITVPFTPYSPDNFCNYDVATGNVTLNSASTKLCSIKGNDAPTKIDVYIWLEGCDPDCTNSIAGTTIKEVALAFAGYLPK